MKIGILTQPLLSNYGGILQCFALQTVLKRLGHDAWVIRRTYKGKRLSIIKCLFHYIKQIIKVFLGQKFVKLSNKKKMIYVKKNTTYFVSKYINPKTEFITTNSALNNYHQKGNFDAYIVGSDQVWRPIYSPCITNYFLDFTSPDEKIKRIAYAASFGVNDWEFTEEETVVCKDLLKKFDAISVREDSAIKLCEKFLGRNDALHVLDPTMLLEKEDYIRLVEKENEPKSNGNLFYYILDESIEKNNIVKNIADKIGATPFTQMPKCSITDENLSKHINDCVFPTVTSWLRAFMDADMIITDSFHGCVFSIIFNKPFWAIGNASRGMARFNSLLSIYGLENRLINCEDIPNDITAPIDWDNVNNIHKEWKQHSMAFLETTLNS